MEKTMTDKLQSPELELLKKLVKNALSKVIDYINKNNLTKKFTTKVRADLFKLITFWNSNETHTFYNNAEILKIKPTELNQSMIFSPELANLWKEYTTNIVYYCNLTLELLNKSNKGNIGKNTKKFKNLMPEYDEDGKISSYIHEDDRKEIMQIPLFKRKYEKYCELINKSISFFIVFRIAIINDKQCLVILTMNDYQLSVVDKKKIDIGDYIHFLCEDYMRTPFDDRYMIEFPFIDKPKITRSIKVICDIKKQLSCNNVCPIIEHILENSDNDKYKILIKKIKETFRIYSIMDYNIIVFIDTVNKKALVYPTREKTPYNAVRIIMRGYAESLKDGRIMNTLQVLYDMKDTKIDTDILNSINIKPLIKFKKIENYIYNNIEE